MIDHGSIEALLRSRPPGHSLPQALYNDADAFAFDLDAIFARCWLFAGFEAEVPRPGDYLSFMAGHSPVVILHGQDGALRAFHNTCRHRGAELCPVGTGRRTRLTCPYHQWIYADDGRLLAARHMPADFDRAVHGLRPVALEAVAGSLYVCLGDTVPDFAPFRSALAPMLRPHNLGDAKLAHSATLVERGNWKLVMENARECYHCQARHPELSRVFPVQAGASLNGGVPASDGSFRARLEARGLALGPFDGPWWQISRFPLSDGVETLTLDGKPAVAKPLCEGGAIGSMRWATEPNSFCHATADSVFAFTAQPVAPGETLVHAKWLVHRDAVEGVDYKVEHLTGLWDATNLQDRELVETNQRGIQSVGYRPGPYNPSEESLVMRFVDFYCDTALGFIAERGRGSSQPADIAPPQIGRLAS